MHTPQALAPSPTTQKNEKQKCFKHFSQWKDIILSFISWVWQLANKAYSSENSLSAFFYFVSVGVWWWWCWWPNTLDNIDSLASWEEKTRARKQTQQMHSFFVSSCSWFLSDWRVCVNVERREPEWGTSQRKNEITKSMKTTQREEGG